MQISYYPHLHISNIRDIYPAYGQHYLQRAPRRHPDGGRFTTKHGNISPPAARFGFDEPEFQASDEQLMDDAFDSDDPRMRGYQPSKVPLDTALPMQFDGEDAIFMEKRFSKDAEWKN